METFTPSKSFYSYNEIRTKSITDNIDNLFGCVAWANGLSFHHKPAVTLKNLEIPYTKRSKENELKN